MLSRYFRNWTVLGIWNEAGQRIIEFCQDNSLVIENILFQQHKGRLYTWTWPDGQYKNLNDYILCSWRRGSIQSAKRRPGADCGSDHELLIAKFRLKLKKEEKTTRPFRYDLIKSLMIIQWKWEIDLRAWWTMDWGLWHCTGDRDQDHPHGKEMQKSKMAVWGGLTNSCEKKRSKSKREKERYKHLNAEFKE